MTLKPPPFLNPLWSNQEINKEKDPPQTHTHKDKKPLQSPVLASGKPTKTRTVPCDGTIPGRKEPPPLPTTGNWGLLQVPMIQGRRQGPPTLTHPACPAETLPLATDEQRRTKQLWVGKPGRLQEGQRAQQVRWLLENGRPLVCSGPAEGGDQPCRSEFREAVAKAVKERPKRAGRSQGAVGVDGLLVGEDPARGKA